MARTAMVRVLVVSAAACAALAPAALAGNGLSASAAAVAHCGNHSVTVEIAEPNQPRRKIKAQTKNVTATNLSCSSAFKFLNSLYKNNTVGPPEHFKCKTGKAKEPRGFFPTLCTKGSKKIEYGAQGG